MRNIKRTFALCLSLIMLILTVGGISAVGAVTIDAAAYFRAEHDGFLVEGTVSGTDLENVAIFIYRPGYTVAMVESGEAKIADALCNTSIERLVNGAFSYTCKASEKDNAGYYTVYIKYGSGADELLTIENVYYAKGEEVNDALDRIEAITGTPEEKLAAFNNELTYIGKLPTDFERLSETQQAEVIDAVIYEGVEFDTVKDLKDAITEASINAIILDPADKETVKYVVENYNDKVGYDVDNKFYKNYVEGHADRIDAVYAYTAAKAPFADTTAAKNAFQEGVILQVLNNLTSKGEIYNRAQGSVSVLGDADTVALLKGIGAGIDMEGYTNLTDVKMELMLTNFYTQGKYKVDSLEKFVTNWNAAVLAAPSLTIPSVSGGGGGGGGGGPIPNNPNSVTLGGNVSTGLQGGAISDDKPLAVEDYFADLAGVEWAQESIVGLAKAGIVNGKDAYNFAPNDNITREEFLKMLYLCANLQVNEEAQTTFIDVNAGEWYYGIVASAQEQGLVNGVSNVRFGVGENITRQDMAVMIVRMISSLGVELELSADESKFVDDARIADYAQVSVYTMKRAGIINGYEDGSFGPNAYATRAEAAKIIYGLCSLMVD